MSFSRCYAFVAKYVCGRLKSNPVGKYKPKSLDVGGCGDKITKGIYVSRRNTIAEGDNWQEEGFIENMVVQMAAITHLATLFIILILQSGQGQLKMDGCLFGGQNEERIGK